MVYVLIKNYPKVKHLFAMLFSLINHLKCYLLFLSTRIFAATITITNIKPNNMVEKNTIQYSNLMPVALMYLGIPGTSACNERIFSKAGQVVLSRRQRLSPQSVEKLVLLHENI